MATYFFAFVEALTENGWTLAHPLVFDEDDGQEVPNNIAPPWGGEAIDYYITLSGERGLPEDMSDRLRDYVIRVWENETYGASWLTSAEIEQLIDDFPDADHFNPAWLATNQTDDEITARVIFWHD